MSDSENEPTEDELKVLLLGDSCVGKVFLVYKIHSDLSELLSPLIDHNYFIITEQLSQTVLQ